MAQQFAASIYGAGANSVGTAQGLSYSFPSQGVYIQPAPSGKTFNGVTVNSVINLLPTGLNQPTKQFYAAASVSTLVTAANA